MGLSSWILGACAAAAAVAMHAHCPAPSSKTARNAIAMHALIMAEKRSREGGHESDGTSDDDSRPLAKPHFLDDLLALHVFLWSFKTNILWLESLHSRSPLCYPPNAQQVVGSHVGSRHRLCLI